jgi:hypothetical protein
VKCGSGVKRQAVREGNPVHRLQVRPEPGRQWCAAASLRGLGPRFYTLKPDFSNDSASRWPISPAQRMPWPIQGKAFPERQRLGRTR